jgi:archaemetzincin
MRKLALPVFSIIVVIFACIGTTRQNDTALGNENKKPVGDSLVVVLQPFVGIDDSLTEFVFLKFKDIIPLVELRKPLPFPENAYYKPRNRYKADSLLTYLSCIAKRGEVMVGLTGKDISTSKDEISDWGVMGLSYCPGKACIASTFRLNKKKLKEQFFKVAIHELGHTHGLDHCQNKTCLMRDAEGKNCTDEEKGFCPICKAFLVGKGWRLK